MNKLIRAQILTKTVSYEKNRTYTEVCCKHKPYYYVQPEDIFIFTGLFYVVAGGTLYFYPGFSVNDLAGLKFWYDYYGLMLGKPTQANKP